MKSQNTQVFKLLQYVVFVYKFENAIFAKKQSNIVENFLNNQFVIYVTFEKKRISE